MQDMEVVVCKPHLPLEAGLLRTIPGSPDWPRQKFWAHKEESSLKVVCSADMASRKGAWKVNKGR
jgi:hypothetical protein